MSDRDEPGRKGRREEASTRPDGSCPGEIHPDDRLMEQKQPGALKQGVTRGIQGNRGENSIEPT